MEANDLECIFCNSNFDLYVKNVNQIISQYESRILIEKLAEKENTIMIDNKNIRCWEICIKKDQYTIYFTMNFDTLYFAIFHTFNISARDIMNTRNDCINFEFFLNDYFKNREYFDFMQFFDFKMYVQNDFPELNINLITKLIYSIPLSNINYENLYSCECYSDNIYREVYRVINELKLKGLKR